MLGLSLGMGTSTLEFGANRAQFAVLATVVAIQIACMIDKQLLGRVVQLIPAFVLDLIEDHELLELRNGH